MYLLPKTDIAFQRKNSFARDYFNMAKNNLKVCQGKFNLKKKDNTSHSRSGYSRSHEIHIKVNNMMHCYCGKKWQLHSFNKYNIMTTWISYVLLSFHFSKYKYCFYFSCYGSWDNSYYFKARNISLTSFIWDVLRTT